jgi:hypothetical protein
VQSRKLRKACKRKSAKKSGIGIAALDLRGQAALQCRCEAPRIVEGGWWSGRTAANGDADPTIPFSRLMRNSPIFHFQDPMTQLILCTLLALIGLMATPGQSQRPRQRRTEFPRHHSYAGAAPATPHPPSGHLLPGAGRRPAESPAPLRRRPAFRSAFGRVFARGPPFHSGIV